MASPSPRQASSPLSRGPSSLLISETFKPKLPLDPFIAMPRSWSLKIDTVISALNAQCRRDVLLILGAPLLRDLEPLLQSQYLESSLLILATHQPPDIIPASTLPAVRIIRLSSPLAIQDAGAVRFVNVLECAERVARVWRKSGGEGIEELSEAELDGAVGPGSLSPPSVFRFTPSESVPTSPQSSTERLPSSRPTTPAKRRLRSSSSATLSKFKGKSLPAIDSTQRPFDCVLNFLPTNVSDKAILKQMILVTTISRPFLTAASNPTRPATTGRSSSRFSIGATEDGRRRSTILSRKSIYSASSSNQSRASLYSSPGSASYMGTSVPELPRRAHLVHLIPSISPSASRSKLMQSMEGFLCSFAYPNLLEVGQPDSAGMERAAPFLMHPHTLQSVVRHVAPSLMPSTASSENVASEWTIADLLLSGALDRSTSSTEVDRSPPRAWIASAKDITFVPGSKPGSMKSVNVAQPVPAAIRERQRDSMFTNDTVDGSGLVRYESSSGTGESAVIGGGRDSGAMTPESTPPSTPETIVATPPSQMEKVFRFSHFRTGGRGPPTAPDSDESESSESSVPQPIRSRSLSMLLTPRRLRSEPGIGKPVNGWNSKWKFWKVSFMTASA